MHEMDEQEKINSLNFKVYIFMYNFKGVNKILTTTIKICWAFIYLLQ